MSDWGRQSMEAWARDRGLAFEGEGLFPAATHLLREGLGAGTHRAGVIVGESDHSIQTVSGLSRKPERHTMNIVRGTLPGGLDGAVGHHFHLEYRQTGQDSDWLAKPHTIVLAYVPEGSRIARELRYGDGYWRVEPAESATDLAELTASAEPSLAGAEAILEMEDGQLCVAVPGVVEDAATLDHLCQIASAAADGVRQAAARYPALDPTAPTGSQVLPPELQWVEIATTHIQWSEPPASVPAAVEAYAPIMGQDSDPGDPRVFWTGLVLVIGLIWFGGVAFLAFVLDHKEEAAVGLVAGVIGAPRLIRAAWQSAGDDLKPQGDDQASGSPGLPGLEAFAREYARSRGMALEDRDEFRRRFASPISGTPLKVMYGDIGGGVTGRIVLWASRDDRFDLQYWNMAVIPAPAGTPPAPAGYRVDRVGETTLALAEPVADEGRSVERLDALRAAAAQIAGAAPAPTRAG